MTTTTHEDAIHKAQMFMLKEIGYADPVHTPFYPRHHVSAPYGWINDPNGLVQHKGIYHAFYQYHPYNCEWGPMHWGHATSKDMVRWNTLPIALAPSEAYDKDGCFSGSAVSDGEYLYLVYTGHVLVDDSGTDEALREVQCLASSRDGVHFVKHGVIIEPPEGIRHFRDPKVWKGKNAWYCVVGAKSQQDDREVPMVILYKSENFREWEFDRVLVAGEKDDGFMFECPDFFELDGEHILMCSPQGMESSEYRCQNLYNSGVMRGHWEEGGNFEVRIPFTELDLGPDFYAPQTFLADDGRRIMMAWANMWKTHQPTDIHGFAGTLTLPRELSFVDGKLVQKPVREYLSLRRSRKQLKPIRLTDSAIVLHPDLDAFEFDITLNTALSDAESFGFALGRNTAFTFTPQGENLRLEVVRNYESRNLSDMRNALIPAGKRLRIQGIFDRGLLEVFLNDGEHVFTLRALPAAGERIIHLFANSGTVILTDGDYWSLAK